MEAGRGDALSSPVKQYVQNLLKVVLYPYALKPMELTLFGSLRIW